MTRKRKNQVDPSNAVRVYRPIEPSEVGLFMVFPQLLRDCYSARELVWQLFRRDFLMAYKKSFLGFGWHLLAPFIGVTSWLFMDFVGVLEPGDTSVPYPIYVLVGSSLWGLFMSFYAAGAETLSAGASFIHQVNYPHTSMLIKNAFQQLVNFCVSFGLVLIVITFFGVIPSWGIVFLPVLILPMFFLGASIGLFVSLTSAYSSDLSRVASVVLGIFMYFTPIVYSSQTKNEIFNQVIQWNPMTYLIGGVRDLIFDGNLAHPERFIVSALIAFVIFVVSLRIFVATERIVVEKMM